jgi:hypothetical protein
MISMFIRILSILIFITILVIITNNYSLIVTIIDIMDYE